MKPYDKTKRYFGPQGSPLNRLIPEAPPTVPILKEVFNKAGYNHDSGYEGEKSTVPFLGKIANYFARKAIDVEFLREMDDGILSYAEQGLITPEQEAISLKYAMLAYKAVRLGGWTFYRK